MAFIDPDYVDVSRQVVEEEDVLLEEEDDESVAGQSRRGKDIPMYEAAGGWATWDQEGEAGAHP